MAPPHDVLIADLAAKLPLGVEARGVVLAALTMAGAHIQEEDLLLKMVGHGPAQETHMQHLYTSLVRAALALFERIELATVERRSAIKRAAPDGSDGAVAEVALADIARLGELQDGVFAVVDHMNDLLSPFGFVEATRSLLRSESLFVRPFCVCVTVCVCV